MAIRYDKKLTSEIRRITRNYNAKIRRLEKQGAKNIPERFDRLALKTLKSNVSSRKDLYSRLEDLKLFTKRGAEKVVNIKGVKLPKYQHQQIAKYQRKAKSRIYKQLKFYDDTRITSLGKKQLQTPKELRTREYLNLKAKEKLLLEKDLSQLDFLKAIDFIEDLQSNTLDEDERLKTWQQNYTDILLDTAYVFGALNHQKIHELRERLLNLTPDKFNQLFATESSLKEILFYYKAINDLGTDVTIDNNDDDVINLFESLYENIETIVKDYE